jgi:hypothetical protein
VLLFSLAWVGGLWLELTAPRHDWLVRAALAHAGDLGDGLLIGVGTVMLYAGRLPAGAHALRQGPLGARWQLIK